MIDTIFHDDMKVAPTGFRLRDYQREDADAIVRAWENGKRGVLCRQATGAGKSVLLAELAQRVDGRVLILVHVGSLARDLARTIKAHTGIRPGIITGPEKNWRGRRIVVATVQSLYAQIGSKRRYQMLRPGDYSHLLIDETEAALANEYLGTVLYFMDGNPEMKCAGVSATPFRTDKRDLAALFDHSNADEEGDYVLRRNVLWGYLNGWLVLPQQGVIRSEIDFNSLKLRRAKNGERDYSNADIARLIMDQDEREKMKLATEIVQSAKGRKSIVICPNNVEVAKSVAAYIEGAAGQDGIAEAVYGAQGEQAHDLLRAYKRNEFQFAVSCKMLELGFDDDEVRCVFMLRRTQSLRVYEQALGRALRPLNGIRDALSECDDPDGRKRIIAESGKPHATMFDLVGIDEKAKNILSVADILGGGVRACTAQVLEQVRQKLIDEAESGLEPREMDPGDMVREVIVEVREEEERKRRRLIQVNGSVQVTERDMLDGALSGRVNGHKHKAKKKGPPSPPVPGGGGLTVKQLALLVACGADAYQVKAYSKSQAGAVIDNYKQRKVNPNWPKYQRVMKEYAP